LNEDITTLLPIGKGEWFLPNSINLEHEALLRRYELPI
jgi:hypothetical protein